MNVQMFTAVLAVFAVTGVSAQDYYGVFYGTETANSLKDPWTTDGVGSFVCSQ